MPRSLPPTRTLLLRASAALTGVALLAGQAGAIGATALDVLGPSPARGSAQVVAQGVLDLDGSDRVWRLVERTADEEAAAHPWTPGAGFLLGSDVLLVDDADGRRVARVADGEAKFPDGATQVRTAGPGGDEAVYRTLELVDADAGRPSGADLLQSSSAFAPLAGQRDVDLLRDVLSAGDQLTLDRGDAPTLVYVESGEVRLTEDGARRPRQLAADDFLLVDDDATIEAIGEAVVFAAVVGPEIPALPAPAPTAAPIQVVAPTAAPIQVVAPTAPTAPTAEPAPAEAGDGYISMYAYDCPEGMTRDTLVPTNCALLWDDAYAVVLRHYDADGGESTWGLAEGAVNQGGGKSWQDLPYGTYLFGATAGPAGTVATMLTTSFGETFWGTPLSGYTFELGADSRGQGVTLYFFHASDLEDGGPDVDEGGAGVPDVDDGAHLDTDGDGIEDDVEVAGCDVGPSDPTVYDTDGDGLSDGDECSTTFTDPMLVDSDRDELSDGDELSIFGTDPNADDSDGDAITDGREVNGFFTDPANADTDGDGRQDGEELFTSHGYGSDPNVVDTDGDGFDDGVEAAAGTRASDGADHP